MKKIFLIVITVFIIFSLFSCDFLRESSLGKDIFFPPGAINIQHERNQWFSFYLGNKKYYAYIFIDGLYGNDIVYIEAPVDINQTKIGENK